MKARSCWIKAFLNLGFVCWFFSQCSAQQPFNTAASGVSTQHAELVSQLVMTQKQRALRFHAHQLAGGGLQVDWIDEGSPTTRMTRTNDSSIIGALEKGDIITHLDGNPINSFAEYHQLLQQANETVAIRVLDIRTGESVDWQVQTVDTIHPIINPDSNANNGNGPRVHCIYAALTSDPDIGFMIERDVRQVEGMITGLIGQGRLATFTKVYGDQCTANGVRNAIDRLQIAPSDSVFFYYEGHGAYDQLHAAGDPAYGHHFQLPGEGLLRREVLNRIQIKQPRFTLLASDCCNVKSGIQEPGRGVHQIRTIMISGWTGLEELLVCHRGIVDLTATSQNEFSWFSSASGGWFTDVFAGEMYKMTSRSQRSWDQFCQELTYETEHTFQTRKQGTTNVSLREQTHMRPMLFTYNVVRDDPSPKPSGPRAIEIPVEVIVGP